MALGSLIVQMAVDLARWRSDMGQAAQISNTRLREIERSATTTVRQLSAVGRSVQNAFAVAGISVSIGALVSGFRRVADEAIQFGDEVQKASARTGLAASTFAELAQAAKLADVEMDTLSKGFRTLQVAISQANSGAKGPIDTFRALGVSVERLRTLKADQQLELLADRILALKDPTDRARAGTELFGRAWQDLAPFLAQGSAGIRSAREEIERLGGSLSEDQIQALADADQAIKRLQASWLALSRSLIADVSPALISILDTINAIRRASREDIVLTFKREGIAAGWDDLADTVKQREQRANIERQLSGNLTPELMQRGLSTVPQQSAPGYTDRAAADRDRARREREALAAQQTLAQQYEDIYKAGRDAIRAQETEVERLTREYQEQKFALEQLAETYPAMAAEAQAALQRLETEGLEPIQITAEKIFPEQERSLLREFALEAARNMQDALAQFFYQMDGSWQDMLRGFVDVLRRMLAEWLATQAAMAASSYISGLFGGTTTAAAAGSAGGDLSAFGVTGMAGGGSIMAGRAYVVGEKGPELFLSKSSGQIIPNGSFGNVNVTYNIDAKGATTDLVRALPAILQENNRRLLEAMRDARSRGLPA